MNKPLFCIVALLAFSVQAQETTTVLGRLNSSEGTISVSVTSTYDKRWATVSITSSTGVSHLAMNLGPKGIAELQRLLNGATLEVERKRGEPQKFYPGIGPVRVSPME